MKKEKEDNAGMLRYIKKEFEIIYDVMESANNEDHLNKALSFNLDLILSDVMKLLINGIQFCKRIKTGELNGNIALILQTSGLSREHGMEGLKTVADDYLIKSSYDAKLKANIYDILETRKKLRAKYGKSLLSESNNADVTPVDQKFLKRVTEIIEEHIDDTDFNVESLSKLVGISRASLYNKLSPLTNHSVKKFIFAIRLKKASTLLKESGMTVTEVAYSVGFKDSSHFSKLFKKHFGVTPKTYINGNL